MSSSKVSSRVSAEEKRKRCLDYFMETADFFQLKDLEKFLPKHKGIVMQTVKEIVQSLVDDRLVSCEKIGTSNYYWSFPSSAAITRTTLIDKLEKENASLKHACERLEAEIQESSKGKDLTPEREELMQRLLELKEESKGLDRQLEEHADRDPAVIEALKKQVALAQQDCNRWVDNIFSVQSYVVDKFGLGKGEFLENFDLPADLDYVQ